MDLFVRTVLKALSDRTMKRRYLVKFEDRMLYTLRWLLPDAIWEWNVAQMFPWSRFPKKA
jgi:hypothetical protein